MSADLILCGEVLYQDGLAKAACMHRWGTEHSHSDYATSEMILNGSAKALPKDIELTCKVWILDGEIVQVNVVDGLPLESS